MYYDCQPIYDVATEGGKGINTLDDNSVMGYVPTLLNYEIDKCVNPNYQAYQSFKYMDETNNSHIRNIKNKKTPKVQVFLNVIIYLVTIIVIIFVVKNLLDEPDIDYIKILLISIVVIMIMIQLLLLITKKYNIDNSEITFYSKKYGKKPKSSPKPPQTNQPTPYLDMLIEDET